MVITSILKRYALTLCLFLRAFFGASDAGATVTACSVDFCIAPSAQYVVSLTPNTAQCEVPSNRIDYRATAALLNNAPNTLGPTLYRSELPTRHLSLWPDIARSCRDSIVMSLLLAASTALLLHMFSQHDKLRPKHSVILGSMLITLALSIYAGYDDFSRASYLSALSTLLSELGILWIGIRLYRLSAPMAGLMLATIAIVVITGVFRQATVFGITMPVLGILSVNAIPNPWYDFIVTAMYWFALASWISHTDNQRTAALCALSRRQHDEQVTLQRNVAAQTAQLHQALQQAENENRQKTEALAFISHDLRAPLATIAGYAKLLRPARDTSEARYVQAIERSIQFQMTLVDELLDYSKRLLEPLTLSEKEVDLAVLLHDVAHDSIALAAQRRNHFSFDSLDSIPHTVTIDAHRLKQVLLNLLSNAAKFTQNGHIRLRLHARPEGAASYRLIFDIMDDGKGIDHDTQQAILAPSRSFAYTHHGGLGLHITERILREMKSQLHVHSTIGQGSRFRFELLVAVCSAARQHCLPVSSSGAAFAQTATLSAMPISAAHPTMPPPLERNNLAELANNGLLTDIEHWIEDAEQHWPDCAAFFADIRTALVALDFERIVALAQGAISPPAPSFLSTSTSPFKPPGTASETGEG